jgi:hypothetical protein
LIREMARNRVECWASMESGARSETRARALIAIGALAGFGALIAGILVLGGGGDEPEGAVAPAECVELWNADQRALTTGIHNASAHGYSRVQVAYADGSATELSEAPVDEGGCIVVFAAQALDPEPQAAAEIHLDGAWTPMSTLAELDHLAELQSDALGAANAELGTDGRLTPF